MAPKNQRPLGGSLRKSTKSLPTIPAAETTDASAMHAFNLPGWTNNALVAGRILLCVGIGWNKLDSIEKRQDTFDTELGKIKQRIADGGTHQIVSQLQRSNRPDLVVANMALIDAQIAVSKSEAKPPDQGKISELSPAIVDAVRRFPDTDESWKTVSNLVTYRTTSFEALTAPQLPVCDSKEATVQIARSRFEPTQGQAYVFHDCRLFLDSLPGKSRVVTIAPGINPPELVGSGRLGEAAYLSKVTLVLGPDGVSDTDILFFEAVNCRFEFDVNRTPDKRTQDLLLAALEMKQAGNGKIQL